MYFFTISGNAVTTATPIRGPSINRPLLAVPKAAGGPNVNLAVMNKVRMIPGVNICLISLTPLKGKVLRCKLNFQ